MKQKLLLAATLAAVALVVAPIATANAVVTKAVLKGTCYIEGKAEFAPEGLLEGVKRKVKYTFGQQEVESQYFFSLKLKPAATCEGTAEESGGLHKTAGSYEIKEAKVEKGNTTAGGAADNGELECGTGSKDSTADVKFEGAVAKLKVKLIGGTKEEYEAQSKFYFEAAASKGEIKAKLDSKTGGGGNKAEGSANFLLPLKFATQKAKCAEKPPAPGAEILPFETANLLGTELGITGTIGE